MFKSSLQVFFRATLFWEGIREGGHLIAGLLVILFSATRSLAGIGELSGDVLIIDPPESVSLSHLEDDFDAKLFVERESFFLEEELIVDVSVPGVVSSSEDLAMSILMNEEVNSYFLHVDPIRNGMPPREYEGSITFSEEILGVIVTGYALDPSDLILGAAETSYAPRDRFRGFEGPGFPAQHPAINDTLELMSDLRTISFHFMTTSRLDQVRIVTRASDDDDVDVLVTPEPSSILSLAAGFLLLLSSVRGGVRSFRRERGSLLWHSGGAMTRNQTACELDLHSTLS